MAISVRSARDCKRGVCAVLATVNQASSLTFIYPQTECCAIDYITHTLDGATALLNSSRYFPSRSVYRCLRRLERVAELNICTA